MWAGWRLRVESDGAGWTAALARGRWSTALGMDAARSSRWSVVLSNSI